MAKKPYNPIIGETFHCSWRVSPTENGAPSQDAGTATGENTNTATENGSNEEVLLTYCAEQVSHHPPSK